MEKIKQLGKFYKLSDNEIKTAQKEYADRRQRGLNVLKTTSNPSERSWIKKNFENIYGSQNITNLPSFRNKKKNLQDSTKEAHQWKN